MDGKSMLTMMLVFVMAFGGLTWYRQHNGGPPAPAPVQNSQAQTAPATTSVVNTSVDKNVTPTSASAAPVTAQASTEQTTIVENELYRITFVNRGARVSSWILKRYKDDNGAPLDLVNQAASKQAGYPLSLYTYDAGVRTQIAQALFVPSTTGTVASPTMLSFDYLANGLHVHKEFRFDQSYVVHATASVTQNGAPVQALLAWPSALGDDATVQLYNSAQLDTAQGGSVTHVAPKKVSGGSTENGPFDWAGISDLYFAAVFLPDAPQSASVVTLHDQINLPRDAKDPGTKYDSVPVLGAGIGNRDAAPVSTRLYAGPKALDVLKTIRAAAPNDNMAAGAAPTGESLEALVDFGFWGFLAKPLFLWLHWTYDHMVRNWGWSILILTLIINIAVLPLRLTSMRSALKMQKIQPQVAAIREKYKKYKMGDPKQAEMNGELQALYKANDVNMFGGCLPTLIQFPLLIAFYSMLGKAIDLRQAHWLWLPDLSRADPHHILPVFFVVSMFLVQYLTPAPGMDPAQRKMMAFMMPAMFGFWTWTSPSGVALYWAGGNIIGVIQQLAMNRTSLGEQMREIAAKRARRKSGQGKLIQGKR